MVEVRFLLEQKKKLASQCIALGLLGEIINLIVFLNTHVWRDEEKDETEEEEDVDTEEEPEEEVTDSPLMNEFEEEIEGLQHDTRVYLFLIIAFGIIAIVAFLLFLLECCKQNEILDEMLSRKESWKNEAEDLKKNLDEMKGQILTLKVDVLEDLEANLFGDRGDKICIMNDNEDDNNNNESQETKSELVLTPKQVHVHYSKEVIKCMNKSNECD